MITIFQDELVHFEKAIYEIWCDDTCKDGKPHKHQVIYFKNNIAFSTIKKVYPTAHIESAKSIFDAINYIKENKNGRKTNIEFKGEEPKNTRFKTVGEIKNVKDENELDWKQYNTYLKIKSQPKKIKVQEWKKEVKIYYIQGPSGIGKSDKIEELMIENEIEEFEEVKFVNGFWTGIVEGTGCCVYDDFRPVMTASEFINFIDYRVHNLNIKGGSIKNNYSLILISSIINIEDIYANVSDEPRKQWMRRINVIDLTPVNI